jgi:NAD(P)-dependent dehydrogenase (short-subunit alcohol dehydrogenase family)
VNGTRRVFVTGSTAGLGRGAVQALLDDRHQVVLHARSRERAADLRDLVGRASGVVVGDLASAADVRSIAQQANSFGAFDAVIHNAGIYVDRNRVATEDGHARVLAVNVLAPYLLTALMEQPGRLVYLSSGMHREGDASLRDLDWTGRRWDGVQAYCDSKLFLTALALAIARRWPDVRSNAVDPGWVPTRMGGPGAPDDLVEGHATQVWLAVSDDHRATVSGRYWYHGAELAPAPAANDPAFHDALLGELHRLTGVALR